MDYISSKLTNLTTCCHNFGRRFEALLSELAVTKNWINILLERVIQLETNFATNAQQPLTRVSES